MEYVIEARDIYKKYPSQKGEPAVAGLNMSIPKGQLYSLVGPDGAGKTTTLRILSTVMEQSSGSASIMGYDVRTESEKARRHIGYMPQNFSLYPDLSVIENLNFFADIHQIPTNRRKERIPEMLSFTRLERFTDRRAGALSGGMKKKLALACALVHDPDVLLLDEPSTGVDPVSRRELWVILASVVQQGVTILVSTPYMDEAERCHRVGMLYGGKILVDGTPDEMTSRLPFEIIEVKAKPRKAMRQIITESVSEGILEWRPVGDRLRLAVANHNGDSQRMMDILANRFAEAALDVRLLRRVKPSMEDVFVHLVDEQRRAS
jgi:ABC-2 type transport system ATP-binding protein